MNNPDNEADKRTKALEEALNDLWEYVGVDYPVSDEQEEFLKTHPEHRETIESIRPQVRTVK